MLIEWIKKTKVQENSKYFVQGYTQLYIDQPGFRPQGSRFRSQGFSSYHTAYSDEDEIQIYTLLHIFTNCYWVTFLGFVFTL